MLLAALVLSAKLRRYKHAQSVPKPLLNKRETTSPSHFGEAQYISGTYLKPTKPVWPAWLAVQARLAGKADQAGLAGFT